MDANTILTLLVGGSVPIGIAWNFINRRRKLMQLQSEYLSDNNQEEDSVVSSSDSIDDDLQPVSITSSGKSNIGFERGVAVTGKTERLNESMAVEYDDRALQAAVVGKQSKTKLGKIGDPITLRQVVEHLNDRINEVPHWMCVGGTGAGKSTFCRLILAYRVARGERFVILAGKRTAVFADIPSIGRDFIASDGMITFDRIRSVTRALLTEVIWRDQQDFDQRNFEVLNIVIDDASILLSEVEEVVQLARTIALIGREIKMRLIILTGSKLLKELGLEGRGDLRDHFAIVTYHKKLDGTRITLLRPRYDENEDSPFDATRVPDLSAQSSIDASMAWMGGQSSEALLDHVVTAGAKGFYGVGMPTAASNNTSNNTPVTVARYTEILRRLQGGKESQHAIAAAVGVSLATVNQIAQALKSSSNNDELIEV